MTRKGRRRHAFVGARQIVRLEIDGLWYSAPLSAPEPPVVLSDRNADPGHGGARRGSRPKVNVWRVRCLAAVGCVWYFSDVPKRSDDHA
jgi:hypothetical protein